MKAKAMILKKFNQEMELQKIDIPDLKNGEILVKITASGVCGSDLHMYEGNDPRIPLPIILGHEGVGKVVQLHGKKKTVEGELLKPGDPIFWNRGVTCGQCYECTVNKTPFLCSNRWVYGISKSSEEKPYLNGCYADHIILAKNTDIFKIPDDIDPAILVPASCSGATAAHCFDYVNPKVGDTVLIQGPGPLGIFAAYFSANLGATEIIMIGGTKKRLKEAMNFGVTHTLNRKEMSISERKEKIMEITKGRGVDYAIEAVGLPSVVKEGLQLIKKGGTYLSVGFGEPNGTVEVDCFRDIVNRNISYQGIWVSDTSHTFSAMRAVINDKELFSSLISHRFKLNEANKALEVVKNREAIKAVLVP